MMLKFKPVASVRADPVLRRKSSKRIQTGEPNRQTPDWIRTSTQHTSDPVRAAVLKQPRELFHRKPSLSNQRPKSPFGKFFVIWNGEAPVGRIGASKNDVAPVLLIEFVSQLSESLNGIAAGNHRQLHPPATSMISSSMLGGTGSPCFVKLLM